MPVTPNWLDGDQYLLSQAPMLAPLISKYSPCTLSPEKEDRYFEILVRGLISQQLPPAVVDEIFNKLEQLLGTITPSAMSTAPEAVLATIGLVPQKISYLKGLAQQVLDKKITLTAFATMTDNEISKQLLEVKGLGQWTVEMFLLLALCRTDVVPSADHVFKKALQNLLQLPDLPKRGQINKLTATWRPWRSLAVWYLWQAAAELNTTLNKKSPQQQ
ncbi:MAG: hypothetical protein RSE47_07930 [Acidaminococcaceae bacterium]